MEPRSASEPPTAPSRRRQVVVLLAAALLVVVAADIAFVASRTREATTPSNTPFSSSMVPTRAPSGHPSATVFASQSPIASVPANRTPMSSPPVITAGSIPAATGTPQMAPGPDGGVYVLIHTATGGKPGLVLALLDPAGMARPGWPIAVDGWSCLAQNLAVSVLSAASDGSIRLVCIDEPDGEGPGRQIALAFDPAGMMLPGWPVGLPAAEIWGTQPQTVGDELHILAHTFAPTDGSGAPQAGTWWIISVGADGTVREGFRQTVPDSARYQYGLAGDGAAYLLGVRDAQGTPVTEIVPLDVDGVRPGWPQTVEGFVSMPTIGPGGRLYFTRTQGTGASARARTLVFERDGRPVGVDSDGLPLVADSDYTGAGGGIAAPTVAADGTAFVVGALDGRPTVYAIDPNGFPPAGWPSRLPVPLAAQGACSGQDTGCGVWRTTPAAGADDTFYLMLAAPDGRAGGSIVAIGIDGQVRAGWPLSLPAEASFWSAFVRPDGAIQALAMAQGSGGDTWALYLIDPDGTVRLKTALVGP
jgi:outer membrane protein assembly factor BamB